MKPQDILFIIILVGLLFLRKPKFLIAAGLLCLLLSIPLFSFWVFFTAERLVEYGAGLLLAAIILIMVKE